MKIGGGVVHGRSRATALPTLLFSHGTPAASSLSACYSSSSFPEHVSFIKDVAAMQPPQHLSHLLRLLKERGESIISPGAKQGLIPLAIPLAKRSSDAVTALLQWPTAPPGMEMPVVEVRKYGVWLLARNVDQFIHRVLVEEDANSSMEGIDKLFHAAAEAGEKLYKKGDFAKSQISDMDGYLLRKVGLFPDVIESKVMQYFAKGDHVSALVTGEFYTKKEHFPGFARPLVFNAEILLKVGRHLEAKDAARGALKSPWWTLGCKYREVADIAQWKDEQIEYIKEKVSEEGKQEDLNKGKAPVQIALDESAFLLDLASVEGTWDDSVERIAECYKEAGLHQIAAFVLYNMRWVTEKRFMELPAQHQKLSSSGQLPLQRVLKINVDCSWLESTKEGSIAGVCRNHDGVLIGGFTRSVHGDSAMIAEALAVQEALVWIKRAREPSSVEEASDFSSTNDL